MALTATASYVSISSVNIVLDIYWSWKGKIAVEPKHFKQMYFFCKESLMDETVR